jgi:hypothetical protein
MHSTIKFIISLVVVLSLSSCGAITHSATPADANQVLAISSRYETKGVKNLGATGQNRTPVKPGQWAAMLSKNKSNPNDVTLQIMKIAAVNGTDVTLEMEQYGAQNQGKRFVIQQHVKNFPVSGKLAYSKEEMAKAVGDVEIAGVKVMDETGQVSEMPQLPFGMGRVGADFINNNVASGEISKASCSNQYLSGSSCLVVPVEVKVLFSKEQGTTYAHSAVPVLAFVKSETGNYTTDVIGFGNSGAQILIR